MELKEKVSYIKGLADGLEYDKTTKEGKLIAALIDMVSELADAQEKTAADLAELQEYVEEIDSDLADIEEIAYEDEDEDEEDYEDDWDDGCDGDCENCATPCDEDDYFEVVCPACGETVCFDQSVDTDNLRCPACGEKFECIMEEDDLKALNGDDPEED